MEKKKPKTELNGTHKGDSLIYFDESSELHALVDMSIFGLSEHRILIKTNPLLEDRPDHEED